MLGRFTSADTVIAGDKHTNAQTVQEVADAMFTPLTVNYSEQRILIKHNADSSFIQQHGGSLINVSEKEKKKAKITGVPLETQTFDRYSYSLNNPMKYTDPTGYDSCGNKKVGCRSFIGKDGKTYYELWSSGQRIIVPWNEDTSDFILQFEMNANLYATASDAFDTNYVLAGLGIMGAVGSGALTILTAPTPVAWLAAGVFVISVTTAAVTANAAWGAHKDMEKYSNNAFEVFLKLMPYAVSVPEESWRYHMNKVIKIGFACSGICLGIFHISYYLSNKPVLLPGILLSLAFAFMPLGLVIIFGGMQRLNSNTILNPDLGLKGGYWLWLLANLIMTLYWIRLTGFEPRDLNERMLVFAWLGSSSILLLSWLFELIRRYMVKSKQA